MKKLIDLIYSYKSHLIKVFLYEALYILLGYKGNNINIRNNEKSTDTIPCPYLFLNKILKTIEKLNLLTFTDIGCGNGRVLFFFKKKLRLKFFGFEIFEDSYLNCVSLFKNDQNIRIFNENFFKYDYKSQISDCYFINDPIKDLNDHNNLFTALLNFHKSQKKTIYYILVNLSSEKLSIFSSLKLIRKYKIEKKGFFVYSSK